MAGQRVTIEGGAVTPLESWARQDAEDFLFGEAALLDQWKLDEWRALFVPDCRYLVPATSLDEQVDSDTTLFLIADDGHHLTERVKRLNKPSAYAERPRSRCLRLISNVRIGAFDGGKLSVRCAFITYRSTIHTVDTFWGYHEYQLVDTAEGPRILEKRTTLAMSTLRPQGKLTIVL